MLTRALAAATAAGVLVAGLSGCSGSSTPTTTAADRTFLQQMIPHHQRAIAVARIGEMSATDPRVQAFAARIVREQSPELTRMQKAAKGVTLDLTTGTAHAMHRITDAQVASLRALTGAAFDRRFVALNVTSEQGAYTMARTELADGHDGAARAVATGISHSPSEIAELQALLTALG